MTPLQYVDAEIRWIRALDESEVRSRFQWYATAPLEVEIILGRPVDGRRHYQVGRDVLAYGGRPLRDFVSVQVDGYNTRLLIDAPSGLEVLTAYTGDILNYLLRTKAVIAMGAGPGAEWQHVDVDRAIAQCLAGAQ